VAGGTASASPVVAPGSARTRCAARGTAPALASFAGGETWAGLRPGSHDGRPYLGATPVEGYVVAGGHYRNGILLAPATAAMIHDAVEGRHTEELRIFSLQRGLPEHAIGESKSAV